MRKPFWQGDLDMMCGVYAVVNAVYLICPELDDDGAEAMLRRIVRRLAASNHLTEAVNAGLSGTSVDANLDVARRIMAQRAIALRCWRPFARRRASLARIWAEMIRLLARHAARPRAIIMCFDSRDGGHWTVVRRANKRKLYLFDSFGRKALRRNRCTTRRRPKNSFRLSSRQLFVIERQK